MKQKRVRRQPQRTCIACQESSGKRELVRLVRTSEGQVEIDETGKKPGRGAYLCHQRSCWNLALQRRSIGRALKVQLSDSDRKCIEDYISSMPD